MSNLRVQLISGLLVCLLAATSATASEILSHNQASKLLEPYRLFYLGEAFFYQRDYENAAAAFQSTLRRASPYLGRRTRARLGEAFFLSGQISKAVPYLESSARELDIPELYYQRAMMRRAIQNEEGALSDFRTLAVRFATHPLGDAAAVAVTLSPEDRIKRAELFLASGLADRALKELEIIRPTQQVDLAPLQAEIAFQKALALFALKRVEDAEAALVEASSVPQFAVQAIWVQAKRALQADRHQDASRLMTDLQEKYPQSKEASEAQFLKGWMAFQDDDFSQAIALFGQFEERYPASRKRDEAAWYGALSRIKLSQFVQASASLDSLIHHFPDSKGVPQASYWRVRSHQLAGSIGTAEIVKEYLGVGRTYLGTFYALLAQARIQELGSTEKSGFLKLPEVVAQPPQIRKFASLDWELPRALFRAGLIQDARGEAAFRVSKIHQPSEALALAQLLQEEGEFGGAYAIGARHLWKSAYGDQDPFALRQIFPLAFKKEVEASACSLGIDAFLIWSIMRRESAFRPEVVSSANAQGLLQLIRPTAEAMAQLLHRPSPKGDELFSPAVNIDLGGGYLHQLLDRFIEPLFCAAAYNAGPGPVYGWMKKGKGMAIDLFVESIPFKETRAYVKQVVADYFNYRSLYADQQSCVPLKFSLTVPEPSAEGVAF